MLSIVLLTLSISSGTLCPAQVARHAEAQRIVWQDGHGAQVSGLCFDPAGHELISWDEDGRVLRWDLGDATVVGALGSYSSGNLRVAFDRAGSRIVILDVEARQASLWDSDREERIAVLGGPGLRVIDFDFSPDEDLVVTADEEGQLRFWGSRDGRERLGRALSTEVTTRVRYSAEGTSILCRDEAGTERKVLRGGSWSRSTGSELDIRYRLAARPSDEHQEAGFRVVLMPD